MSQLVKCITPRDNFIIAHTIESLLFRYNTWLLAFEKVYIPVFRSVWNIPEEISASNMKAILECFPQTFLASGCNPTDHRTGSLPILSPSQQTVLVFSCFFMLKCFPFECQTAIAAGKLSRILHKIFLPVFFFESYERSESRTQTPRKKVFV